MKDLLILSILLISSVVSAQTPDKDSFDELLLKAELSFNQKEFVTAIQLCTQVLEIDSNHRMARVHRTVSKFSVKDYYGAISDASYLMSHFASDEWTLALGYGISANCEYELGNLEKALALAETALKISPHEVTAWDVKSKIEFEIGKYEEAIASASNGIAVDEKNRKFYLTRAQAYHKLNKKELGCADLSRAGELGSKNAYVVMKMVCN